MKNFHICCGILSVLCGVHAARINVQGQEGDGVSFICLHSFASSNKKYFCRDPCRDADVLVEVEPGGSSRKDRVSLNDSGNGDCTVTFQHLQMSDEGLYYCGVDRVLQDTFISVQLTVLNTTITLTVTPPSIIPMVTPGVPAASWPPGSSSTTPTVSPSSPTTEISLTTEGAGQVTALYCLVVVVVTLIIMGVAVVFYRKCRGRNRKSSVSSGPELHLDNIAAEQVERVDRPL